MQCLRIFFTCGFWLNFINLLINTSRKLQLTTSSTETSFFTLCLIVEWCLLQPLSTKEAVSYVLLLLCNVMPWTSILKGHSSFHLVNGNLLYGVIIVSFYWNLAEGATSKANGNTAFAAGTSGLFWGLQCTSSHVFSQLLLWSNF